MHHSIPTTIAATAVHPPDGLSRQQFAFWLDVNGHHLAALADWLGGPSWRARSYAVSNAARGGVVRLGPIRELLGLFALHHVGDLARSETGRFAGVDPGHPYVHECCLAAESLARGLAVLVREDDLHASARPLITRRAA